MALKVNSDIALTGSLTVSGSYGLAAADIPSLAADKITSGTFAAARIPSLAASKITSGTFADARIASAANWNTAYSWGNHAAAGYSTFDGAYDSLTGRPTIPTNNNQLTNGAGYITSVPTTLSGNRTIGGDLTVSGNQVITTGSNADVKFSVWSGTTYGIGMTSGVTYGGLNDYAMTFCMNNDSDRGFWWGYSGQSKSAGAMSLTTAGVLTVASSITAGGTITASGGNSGNWNTAYGWGNHASAGYSTSDTNYYLNGISKSGNTLTFSVNGTTNQSYTFGSLAFSSATYDNYGSWNLKTGGVQRTTVGSGGDLDIVGGENVTVGYGAGGVVTISASDTNTQLSDAQVRSKISGTGLINYNSSTGVISTTANNYSLPAGSSSTRGGFKIGYTENGKNYPVEVSSEQMYVNVPWTDTNTTYSTATSSTLGLVKIGYTENGKNYPVELSSGQMYVNVPWTDTNTTYSVGDGGLTQVNFTTARSTKLDGIAEGANAYSLPAGSSTTRGGFKIGYTENGKNYPVEVSSEKMYVNVPWTDTNTTYSNATTSVAGLMSTTDKSKLDGIAASANNYSLPAGSSTTRGGFKIGYAENGKNYPVEVSSEKMYVNVPWTDTDTNTVTSVGVSGSETTGTITLAASGAASISQLDNTVTISATNTTYSEYSGGSAGLVPSGQGDSSKYLSQDGSWTIPTDTNTTYSAGAGLDLTGTTFSVESNLAGDVYTIGRDGNDKYTVNTTNHAWYLDGVLDMRLNNDGNLDVDGDVIAYSTVTSSDRKLKTDIKTLENACEKVCNLRGVSFTWDHGRKTGKKDIGLIAQEVEQVVPEIVGEAELLDGTMAKHVDYPKLVALLIEANKELCDRISNLEARLNGITE